MRDEPYGQVYALSAARQLQADSSNMPFSVTTLSREKVNPKSPRLRSNESPSGAFKRQNVLAGARWRGLAPTSSAGLAVLLFHEDKLLLVQWVFVWGRFVWLL